MDARNPTGINSEISLAPGYGDVTKLANLTKAAPLANSTAPAPSQSQGQPQVQPPPMMFSHPAAEITPQVKAALAWARIAQIPGASPQVIQYAGLAAREAGL